MDDDINRRMMDARRREARQAAEPAPPDREDEPEDAPSGPGVPGELHMERRQGEWRYYLGEDRVRPGQAIEFYVDARIGWVRGVFHWGRRNVSVATIRVPVCSPDDGAPVGELEVTLPDGARCRRPE